MNPTLLAFLLLPSGAPAYQVMTNGSGSSLRWEEMPVRFYLNPVNLQGIGQDDVEEALLKAVAEWEGAGAAVWFEYLGFTTNAESEHDGESVIYFSDDWSWDPLLLALNSNWSTEAGTMVEFDIALNADDWGWGVDGGHCYMDLQNALTHELGHALGLWHSDEDDLATMWGTTSAGETAKRDLRPDDREGLMAIYGPATPMGMACASTPAAHAPARGPLAAFLLAMGLSAVRRRQLRP